MTLSVALFQELIGSARSRRYPTVLLAIEAPEQIRPDTFAEVGTACGLAVVDFRKDVLSCEGSGLVLGAYSRGQFITWLVGEARARQGVFVYQADEVIAAWPEADRKAFFVEFLKTECNDPEDRNRRAPIVLVSLHATRFTLPNEERGQGILRLLNGTSEGELS